MRKRCQVDQQQAEPGRIFPEVQQTIGLAVLGGEGLVQRPEPFLLQLKPLCNVPESFVSFSM